MNSDALFEVLHAHRSVRKYLPDPVDEDTVRGLIEAGQRAATSSNLQMTTAVVVRDRERREELARLCGDQDHIRQAPVFIAWCADRHRLDRVSTARRYEQNTDFLEAFLVAVVDVAIMMQNVAIAAEGQGLGICYIGGLRNNSDAVIDLLELPHLVFPIAGMTIGRPAPTGKPPRVKPRLDVRAVLHWERYNKDTDAHLRDYDRIMAETGIYRGREAPVPAGTGLSSRDGVPIDDTYGWMEHTARRIARPKRTDLSEVVRRQGYGLR